MASGLSMPLGFKNGTDGSLTTAVNAIKAAAQPHTFLGINLDGSASAIVTRGNPASHNFSACYLRGGELIALDSINNPKDQMAARKLIAARARPSLDKLADPGIPLKDCV